MSEVLPAEFPNRRRRTDYRYKYLLDLFQDAESKLKKAEHQCGALSIPSLNELRYTAHHLLNALNANTPAQEEYEFQEAESHCKRAIFDAVEIRLMDHLRRIEEFEKDYQHIEILPIISNYLELRAKYLAVKTTLKNVEHTCREEYLTQCETHLIDLEAFNAAIDSARPELQKAVSRERQKAQKTVRDLTIAIAGIIIAIVGLILKFSSKD